MEERTLSFRRFKIDFSKVNSIEDIKEIFIALDLLFVTANLNDSNDFKNLCDKGLLVEVE